MLPFIVFSFILGSVFGSFSKALADRSLSNKSFWKRSYCFSCKHKLSFFDLFPIISYLLLGGKCRYCHKKIEIDYLLVEVVYGLIFAAIFWQSAADLPRIINSELLTGFIVAQYFITLLLKIFFITVLGMVTLTDLKKMLIPDRIILPAILGLLFIKIFDSGLRIGYLYTTLNKSIIGRLLLPPHSEYFFRHAMFSIENLVYSVLCGLGIAGFFLLLIFITRGKGMGGGDVKLGAFIGLMLGFPNSILAIILAFFSGAVVALCLIATGKKSFGQSLPFGPFLVFGSLLSLFWGDYLVQIYLH